MFICARRSFLTVATTLDWTCEPPAAEAVFAAGTTVLLMVHHVAATERLVARTVAAMEFAGAAAVDSGKELAPVVTMSLRLGVYLTNYDSSKTSYEAKTAGTLTE